jgi:hypothetical protein
MLVSGISEKDLSKSWIMNLKITEEKRDKNLLIVRYNHAAALLDVSPYEKYFYIS